MRKSSDYVGAIMLAALNDHGSGSFDVSRNIRLVCHADGGGCERAFFGVQALREHAEAVHTFDDIRRILRDYLREKYGKPGDYNASPPVPGTWTWIEDLSADWVVFTVEHGEESTLYKADYSIDASNEVTLGAPVEVVRRTVYDPVS